MNAAQSATLSLILAAGLSGDRLAVDTETNARSLDSAELRCRLVSVASSDHSIVLPTEGHEETFRALLGHPGLSWVCHNAEFDRAVLRATLGVELTDVRDTYVVAHLADPRQRSEGGTGHRLGELGERYGLKTKETDLLAARMKSNLWTWATIPINDEVYLSYAETDARLTKDLLTHLDPADAPSALERFEYEVAGVCAAMERRGVLVDRPYTEGLVIRLHEEAAEWADKARELGVANVNSPVQVARALGTDSAAKETLLPLAGLNPDWSPVGDEALTGTLAYAVLRAKRADRWASAYGQAFLDLSEPDGRLHPFIAPLRARTGRMAISNPPLQQLPAGEASVRRCLVADEGQVMWSVDFAAVEMRVLAALSKDRTLTDLILSGEDVHDYSARTVYGPDFTKAHRRLAKIAGFAIAYGGGVKAIATQTGIKQAEAKRLRDGWLAAFPGVGRYMRQMSAQAERRGFIVTRTGRRLPVDRDRAYSACNFSVQSAARDLFAEAVIRVNEAGLGQHLLLPIHDELLGQAPAAEAASVAHAVAEAMSSTLDGVPITTDFQVGRRSWGSLYGSDE